MKHHFFTTCGTDSASASVDLSSSVVRPAGWNDRIARREMPSQAVLKALFDYDPEEGLLRWRPRDGNGTFNTLRAGNPAGYKSKRGYWQITLERRHYWNHRLIWKMVYGVEPREIDHIDGDKSNNRLANLRDVDRSANSRNVRRYPKSGVVGVHYAKIGNRWTAQIRVRNATRHLGNFVTKAEAVAARKGAEMALRYYDIDPHPDCEIAHGYADKPFSDDVDPAQRPMVPLRVVESLQQKAGTP